MTRDILCVDELGVTNLELLNMMKSLDVNVIHAENAAEVLNHVEARNYTISMILWVIDTYDEDFSIYDSIGKIKAKEAFLSIPLIIISKYSDKKHLIKAIEAGAVEFIAKPYDSVVLRKKLCGLLSIPTEKPEEKFTDDNFIIFNLSEMLSRELKSASRGEHPVTLMQLCITGNEQRKMDTKHTGDILYIMQKILKTKLRETDSTFFYGKNSLILLLPFTEKEGVDLVKKKVENIYKSHGMLKNKINGYQLAISSVTFPDDGKIKEKLLEKMENNTKVLVENLQISRINS